MSDLTDFIFPTFSANKEVYETGMEYAMPQDAFTPGAAPTLEPLTTMPAGPDTTKGARRKAEAQRLRRRRGRASTMLTSTLGGETLGG